MEATSDNSDLSLMDLMRLSGGNSVSELAVETGVTATAVRQRLNRLMGRGLVERQVYRSGRGRPSHKYSLTEKGLRDAGTNYGDLATVLWNELRSIEDPAVRRGLLQRIADGMAQLYGDRMRSGTLAERMQALGQLFEDRRVPFTVDTSGDLPVLKALACPYPDLAEQDRAVCAMERILLSELVGQGLRLTQCRLDGESCCTFEAS